MMKALPLFWLLSPCIVQAQEWRLDSSKPTTLGHAEGREYFQKPGWAVRNVIAVIPRDTK